MSQQFRGINFELDRCEIIENCKLSTELFFVTPKDNFKVVKPCDVTTSSSIVAKSSKKEKTRPNSFDDEEQGKSLNCVLTEVRKGEEGGTKAARRNSGENNDSPNYFSTTTSKQLTPSPPNLNNLPASSPHQQHWDKTITSPKFVQNSEGNSIDDCHG